MRYLYFIFLSLCLLLSACSHHYNEELTRAEALIHEYPDSALHILQVVPTDSFNDEELHARYALFFTMAQHKCYINVSNDSLISVASEYYAQYGPQYYRMLAYYYHAYILFNQSNFSRSSLLCLKAEKEAIDIEDHFYQGQTYWLLGDIFLKTHNTEQYLYYAQKARESFDNTDKERFKNYALIMELSAYIATGQYDQSIEMIQEELLKAYADEDSIKIVDCLHLLVRAYLGKEDYENAKQHLFQLKNMDIEGAFRKRNYADLAYIYAQYPDMSDSAQYYLSILDADKEVLDAVLSDAYAHAQMRVFVHLGQYDKAYNSAQKIIQQERSMVESSLKQAILSAMKDQYNADLCLEQKNKQIQKYFYSFCLMSITIFSIVVLIIMWHKIRSKKRYYEEYLAVVEEELQSKQKEVLTLDQQYSQEKHNYILQQQNLQQQLSLVFRSQYNSIDKVLCSYSDYSDSKFFYKDLEKIIHSFSSREMIETIENNINLNLDNILTDIKVQLPWIKPHEYLLLIYFISGFTARSIALFLNDNYANIRNRKARLIKKIVESEFDRKEELLIMMRK